MGAQRRCSSKKTFPRRSAMPDHDVQRASTTEGLPIAPSMSPSLDAIHAPRQASGVDRRVVFITALGVGIALVAGLIAQCLTRLIALVTNLAFFHRFSLEAVAPGGHQLG